MADETGSSGLPRTARLRAARDFHRVYSRGRRARGRYLIVVACPRRARTTRVGLSVSKKHGRAVRRNKIKRMLREAFRLERADLPGSLDLVLIPVPRERYPLEPLRAELRALVGRLAGELRGRGRRKP